LAQCVGIEINEAIGITRVFSGTKGTGEEKKKGNSIALEERGKSSPKGFQLHVWKMPWALKKENR